jgi:hypothetical protein
MSVDTADGHQAMDYNEHLRTYEGFVRIGTVLVGLTALILLGMAFFLV